MSVETAWLSLFGGILIGLSASLLLAMNGNIAGISGIVAGFLQRPWGAGAWRSWFLGGFLVMGLLLATFAAPGFGESPVPDVLVVLAGLLVGFGTRLGGGCTSGHGVCGVSRLSARSVVATAVFVAAGMLTVYVIRHVLGLQEVAP